MNPAFFAQVIAPYVTGAAGWIGPILNLAGPLFWIIASLELMCVFAETVVQHDLMTMFDDLVYSAIGIGIASVIFTNAAAWGEDLWSTFGLLGGTISGVSAPSFSPDAIMADGQQIFMTIWAAVGVFTLFKTPTTTIAILLCALAIFVIFLHIAIVLMMLTIEAFFAIIGGSIVLPFAVFRFTKQMTASWSGWIFGVGVQLFFTYLVMGIALPMVNTWITGLTPGVTIVPPSGFAGTAIVTTNILVPGTLLAQTLVLWALAVYVPKQARRRVEGAVDPYFGGFDGVMRAGFAAEEGAAAMAGGAAALINSDAATAAGETALEMIASLT